MKHLIRNTEQVQALLNGATQLRIPVNKDWIQSSKAPLKTHDGIWHFWNSGEHEAPFQIDEEVFVKETFRLSQGGGFIVFKAGGNDLDVSNETFLKEVDFIKWESSVHLTKPYSRFTLKIQNIKVEKLQDISFVDILEMGAPNPPIEKPFCVIDFHEGNKKIREWFTSFWNSSAKDGFKLDDNPYVFVYDYEIVKGK